MFYPVYGHNTAADVNSAPAGCSRNRTTLIRSKWFRKCSLFQGQNLSFYEASSDSLIVTDIFRSLVI